VQLDVWRGAVQVDKIKAPAQEFEGHILIKRERMPDGVTKYILKDKKTGQLKNVMR
jgi:hypothetical protein